MPSIEDVRRMMDADYAANTAYKSSLPFDTMRGQAIRHTTLTLAESFFPAGIPRTLDVGSGEGGIASFWPHQDIVGIEISPVAVDRAKRAYPGVDYRACPVEQFSLQPDEKPFELVVAQESIEHWTDAKAGLQAIAAACYIGAGLVLTTPNRDSLHCRISRKLGLGEPPYCSKDHVHEFRFRELVDLVTSMGFVWMRSVGVGLLPYWAMESVMGHEVRQLTDRDPEVNVWMNEIAASAPAEYAFIQCHAFRYVPRKE